MSIFVSHTPVGDSNRLALGPNPGDLIVDGIAFNVKDLVGREPAKETDMTNEKATELEKRIADIEKKQEALANIGGGNTIVDGQVVGAAEAQARALSDAGLEPAHTDAIALEDAKAEQQAITAQQALDAKEADKAEATKAKAKTATASKAKK